MRFPLLSKLLSVASGLLLAGCGGGRPAAAPPAYSGLTALPAVGVPAYCTPGHEARAATLAARCADALAYVGQPARLGFRPRVTLLVLDSADWQRYARRGQVYGMPHTASGATVLVVAATNNALWRRMVPPLAGLPAARRALVETTYRPAPGQPLTMQPFFDLTALHELGHAVFRRGGRDTSRHWLDEFFASLLLHTYVAERAPKLLPQLEVFPQLVVDRTDPRTLPHTSLADFERLYHTMEKSEPRLYGWYQSRLHRAVAALYRAEGPAALPRLWRALPAGGAPVADSALTRRLRPVGPALADLPASW